MRFEYRMERLPVLGADYRIQRLLERLHEQSPKGWRVVGLDLGIWTSTQRAGVKILLERRRRAARHITAERGREVDADAAGAAQGLPPRLLAGQLVQQLAV